ncbi:carbohydrate ABC transporter permease [Truepera radiovictrix]|uniref:Binding-protein-dependent transport systems inner membrane component n=1 Tax=Truepera radiovictrix (strain DSM 17093 / CIP 108686 / LMG 22925 / RQ-24) TaxID=649638 RepID=D7CX59_TRURR|nr:carbohydrate ABC transporter permease [Truepera radiovictrix]ADI14567.1 binding-protein-dependent transport systems inner membrane component [Truepera radiovictrix DSM 17093]WMT56883.1 carbohydrate ABC transporter permease [Truepera radiovictrix]
MTTVSTFLTRRRGRRLHVTDVLTYLYLAAGVLIMFGPVLWLVLSSFKTPSALLEFPPALLPTAQATVTVEGYDTPLPLFDVTLEDGSQARLAQVRRIGLEAQMIDPAAPDEIISVPTAQRQEVRRVQFAWNNYTEPLARFNFVTFLRNSVVVTVTATLITLLINSMAAFALSKYEFRGRNAIFLLIIATLMIPISVILVPVYLVITQIGWTNNLWGVILPGAATPTGVFLLRQYMLTLPDELLDSARIDGASEWRIYWQIILPLTAPALAVLAIFSVMWRWNDFLWPLIVLTRSELFTLQVGLNSFQGELNIQWHYVLAMTVLTLLPVTVVFAFLQRYITTGVATTGLK